MESRVPSEYKAAKMQTFIPRERFKLALFRFCPPSMRRCLGDKVAKNKVHKQKGTRRTYVYTDTVKLSFLHFAVFSISSPDIFPKTLILVA